MTSSLTPTLCCRPRSGQDALGRARHSAANEPTKPRVVGDRDVFASATAPIGAIWCLKTWPSSGALKVMVPGRSAPTSTTPSDAHRARVEGLFGAHLRLGSGWQALQQLHGLYLAGDHDGALEALGRFCNLYGTGELPEFHDIVDAIIAWSDEILSWHRCQRPSSHVYAKGPIPVPDRAFSPGSGVNGRPVLGSLTRRVASGEG